jgi:hypothetical protein
MSVLCKDEHDQSRGGDEINRGKKEGLERIVSPSSVCQHMAAAVSCKKRRDVVLVAAVSPAKRTLPAVSP